MLTNASSDGIRFWSRRLKFTLDLILILFGLRINLGIFFFNFIDLVLFIARITYSCEIIEILWHVQEHASCVNDTDDLVNILPRSLVGALELVGLLQQIDLVFELSEDRKVLTENFRCSAKTRDDDLLIRHAFILSRKLVELS